MGTTASPVLRVSGVEKSFHRGIWPVRRTIPVLKGAALEVRPGELVGLVGENGSGKSTLMQIIVGLLGKDAGEVERPPRLGYCPQLPMLWEKLTVDEHFELFARAYGLAEEETSRSVNGLLAELDFAKLAATYLMLFLVLTDLGVVQNPMFHTTPGRFAVLLPGYGPSRMMYDGAFSSTFLAGGEALLSLAWLAALAVCVYLVLRRAVRRRA
ncbi:MAG: ATP-binding cassette domain-containing protein [Thermoleophilia bacterium]|nr:ATP-binding cassette domain-containing protein [Thermoleophilia bacterium]